MDVRDWRELKRTLVHDRLTVDRRHEALEDRHDTRRTRIDDTRGVELRQLLRRALQGDARARKRRAQRLRDRLPRARLGRCTRDGEHRALRRLRHSGVRRLGTNVQCLRDRRAINRCRQRQHGRTHERREDGPAIAPRAHQRRVGRGLRRVGGLIAQRGRDRIDRGEQIGPGIPVGHGIHVDRVEMLALSRQTRASAQREGRNGRQRRIRHEGVTVLVCGDRVEPAYFCPCRASAPPVAVVRPSAITAATP